MASINANSQPCQSCQRPVAASDAFCRHCGQPTRSVAVSVVAQSAAPTNVCGACGQNSPASTAFCIHCGQARVAISQDKKPSIASPQTDESIQRAKERFAELEFRFPFRKYQRLILDRVEATKDQDHKFHIVAPPGSGKTIVGLELIKRFGYPAVVFAPTSTIQLQWKQKVGMFLPETEANRKSGKKSLDDFASIKPADIQPINIYTYQLIGTPADNIAYIEEAALGVWQENLISQSIAAGPEEAATRVRLLKKNNPAEYKRELSKHYKTVKDRYLSDPEFDGSQLLHPNARKLIDDLVEHGVRTIVMDESHHLLDYWALVIKTLLKRIDNPILIGLTATPPLSASEEGLENYLSIMGDIDFEIPTPAVVKEGNLAPYQDLVYFCSPTDKEKVFISSVQDRFQKLIEDIANRDGFQQWVNRRIVERPLENANRQDWTAFFNGHVFLAVAGVKYLSQIMSQKLPDDVVVVEEMEQAMTIDDWVYLLADYSLNYLKLSQHSADHSELEAIKRVLQSFGYALTEQGIRQQRALSDRIMAFSEAKHDAVTTILQNEMQAGEEALRAVVITDFEKQSTMSVKYLKGVLDPESSGAVRVFRTIVGHPVTTRLEPVLVTGSTVLIDKDELQRILAAMEVWRQASGLNFNFETEATGYDSILELAGSGPDWKSNTYVRMMTDLFDKGVIKCLVGTRGILGEGWDSLSLNTLIDLTQATTSMTVNQIRGRSIRLDPSQPDKVANNWDVVCVDTSFEKGDQDLNRFLSKHNHFYGLGSKGKIVKGVLHVDEQLSLLLASFGFKRVPYDLMNRRMLARARNRSDAYRAWGIGEPFSNFAYTATKLDASDVKFKTVFRLRDSLKAIGNAIVGALVAIGVAFWTIQGIFYSLLLAYPLTVFAIFGLFVTAVLYLAGRQIQKYIVKGFIEIPIDSYLVDIAKSLAQALSESKLISSSNSVDSVRVVIDETGFYDVYLDYASREDARLFSRCLKELLGPVTDQRYLVSRSIDTIKLGFYSPIWWGLRQIFRFVKQEKVAYHPVPTALSTNRKLAETFARAWQLYVGGGALVYTRSAEGARMLLELRSYNRHKIKRMNYDVWR